jgi:hypothetical protein
MDYHAGSSLRIIMCRACCKMCRLGVFTVAGCCQSDKLPVPSTGRAQRRNYPENRTAGDELFSSGRELHQPGLRLSEDIRRIDQV